MTKAIGIILLLASAVAIFLIARQYPFAGTVVFEFQEVWLWIVLVVVIFLAGIGGYLAFRRRALTRYD